MSSSLECRNVSKSFLLQDKASVWRIVFGGRSAKRLEALKNVTIDAPKGQFVGLLGKNGAGKSTLLRTIGGVYAPDSGVVIVNGDMSALYELGITGNDHLSGRGFTNRWFDVYASPGDRRKVLVADVKEFSELADAFERPIRSYSAGMKARLFFALATARKSKIYIIDEVLAVGDEYFQNKCWRRIRQRLAGGASGIIATHDWSAVLRLCQTAHIIERGRITARGSSARVVQQYLGLSTDGFGEGARFNAETPRLITARSLGDFEFEIGVKATDSCKLHFGVSIEMFEPGSGWEHVLHADNQPVGVGPGEFRVALSIPRLPLKAGEYSLCLFLSKSDGQGGLVPLQAFSWTYGEGLTLRVEGDTSAGAIRWPLEVLNERLAPETAPPSVDAVVL